MKKFLCFILTFLLSLTFFSCNSEVPVKLDILSIGKADCILIRDGEKNILIDTGEDKNADEILSYLTSCAIAKIDLLILTHFDKDHAGGFKPLSENIQFSRIIRPVYASEKPSYQVFCDVVNKLGIEPELLHEKAVLSVGNTKLTLHPAKDVYNENADNNSSIITELAVNGKTILFCGDAENDRLADFISAGIQHYDAVKLPHHGKYHAPLQELLINCGAKYAVITDSEKNPADEETLDLLTRSGITAYETKNGTVSIHIYPDRELYITQK